MFETLEGCLDTVQVENTLDMDTCNFPAPFHWAVTDENGIVALFTTETDACRYRLDLINRRLNP